MCLGHTIIFIFGKFLSGIEKVLTAFSIPEKLFPKMDNLIIIT